MRDEDAPHPDLSGIKGKLPILGICYGAQYLAHFYGGDVAPSGSREYGRANLGFIDHDCILFKDIEKHTQVWMSHGDTITRLPASYRITASTEDVELAGYKVDNEDTWAIQFHPEVYHTTDGMQLLRNFAVEICRCQQNWTPASFVETTVLELREKLGNDKVVLGLSGGVDSSVTAMLLNRAIGTNQIGRAHV